MHIRSFAFSRISAVGASVALLVLAALPNACSSDVASDDTTPDGAALPGTDGGTVDAATCDKHLPSGFTDAAPIPSTDTQTGYYGAQVSMVLDENDDPMFAFFSGAGAQAALWFTQWDACAGAFTAPLKIDSLPNGVGSDPGVRDIGIAYDLSTKEVGIVYNTPSAGNSVGDGNSFISLATRKAGATTFTTQVASVNLTSVSGTAAPVIAMTNGTIYLAYTQGDYECGTLPSCTQIQFATSSTTAPAGDPDAGTGPYYFTAEGVNIDGLAVQVRNRLSMAVDSNGKPGLALFQLPTSETAMYNTSLLYWQSGMASAVKITDTNNVQNDNVVAALQYEGTKPRIVADMTASASPTSYLSYFASNDGVTWTQPIAIPEDNSASNSSYTIAFALDGAGNGIVVSDLNGGPSKCADPYLAQTTNDGTNWAACVTDQFAGSSWTLATMNAAYGQARIKGKFVLGFQNSNTNPDPKAPNGVWVYQSP